MGERRLAVVGGATWAGFAVATGYGMALASLPFIWILLWCAFTLTIAIALLVGRVARAGHFAFRGAWFIRGAVSALIFSLIIAWPLHRSLQPAGTRNWSELLNTASGCGATRRCSLRLDGYTASTGAPVKGIYRIVGQRDGGLILDMGDEHWWVAPAQANYVPNHVLPSHYTLVLGDRMLTRVVPVDAGGLTVSEVGIGLWDALDSAPDPLSIGEEYRWDVGDVRVNGELTLKPGADLTAVSANSRMRIEGNRVLLDYATFGDLANGRLKAVVQSSNISVTLPWAIPEPNLKVNRDMGILRDWARE